MDFLNKDMLKELEIVSRTLKKSMEPLEQVLGSVKPIVDSLNETYNMRVRDSEGNMKKAEKLMDRGYVLPLQDTLIYSSLWDDYEIILDEKTKEMSERIERTNLKDIEKERLYKDTDNQFRRSILSGFIDDNDIEWLTGEVVIRGEGWEQTLDYIHKTLKISETEESVCNIIRVSIPVYMMYLEFLINKVIYGKIGTKKGGKELEWKLKERIGAIERDLETKKGVSPYKIRYYKKLLNLVKNIYWGRFEGNQKHKGIIGFNRNKLLHGNDSPDNYGKVEFYNLLSLIYNLIDMYIDIYMSDAEKEAVRFIKDNRGSNIDEIIESYKEIKSLDIERDVIRNIGGVSKNPNTSVHGLDTWLKGEIVSVNTEVKSIRVKTEDGNVVKVTIEEGTNVYVNNEITKNLYIEVVGNIDGGLDTVKIKALTINKWDK